MSLFFVISTTRVVDEARYKKYIELARPILESYGAEYILQSGNIIASKDWDAARIVIIRFDSKAKMDECFQSPEYQEIVPLREGSIESRFVMVEE